jgi:hypothetical protein
LGYGHIGDLAASIGVDAEAIWDTALQSQHLQFGSRFELLEFQQGWFVRACRKHTIDVLVPPTIGKAPRFAPPPLAPGADAPPGPVHAFVAMPVPPWASEATLSRRARRKEARSGHAAAGSADPPVQLALPAKAKPESEDEEDGHLDPRASCAHPPRDMRAQRVEATSGGEVSSDDDDSGSPHVNVVAAGHGRPDGPKPAKTEEVADVKEELEAL